MIESESLPPISDQKNWQNLDEFVAENQEQLAALAWNFHQERVDSEETLGIDLKPTPHFVSCSRQAIEMLNQNAGNRLREVLGILDGYQPQEEVLMIAIGSDQIKLVFFKPEPTPPECLEQTGKELNTLLDELQTKMAEKMGINPEA